MGNIVLLCGLLLLLRGASCVSPTVTADAVYVGVTTRHPTATPLVNKWIGMRYSDTVPRFSPPKLPSQSTRVVQLSGEQPAACVQQFNFPGPARAFVKYLFDNPTVEESEDCLFLNVYAPANASRSSLPVLFWIYGGAFQFGAGTSAPYDGTSFAANQGVVVVTFNYRTNVFGFPGESPDVPDESRNLGLQDINLATEWVQKYIAGFGGDPKKVTLFGESAGAVAVDYLTLSQYKKPNFRAAIMQSGTAVISPASAFSWGALQPQEVAGAPWDVLARALNCFSLPFGIGQTIFQCIKAASALTIQGILEKMRLAFPKAVVDNKFVFEDAIARRKQGLVAKVPILIGSNAQEGKLFTAILLTGSVPSTDALFDIENLPFISGLLPDAVKSADVKRGWSSANFKLQKTFSVRTAANLIGDSGFTCPAAKTAAAHAAVQPKTWRYWYNGDFPNAIGDIPFVGACHASEVPIVWNNFDTLSSKPSAQELAVSKAIQTMWANFAKDPDAGPGWSPYGTDKGQQIVGEIGGSSNPTGVTEFNPQRIDGRCAFLNPLFDVLSKLRL